MAENRKQEQKKALIAMSGGVDSSVAAALMQREGYDCAGAMMKLHRSGDRMEADGADQERPAAVRTMRRTRLRWRGSLVCRSMCFRSRRSSAVR